ncbi:MAG: aerial mycelium formation protein [Acidimicrobiales bacterium]
MPKPSLDELLAPSYVEALEDLPLPEVRARRGAATEVETGLSYLRRLIQGRLDIVAAERDRRAAGQAEGDVADLVERLPGILSDHVRAPGLGRLPSTMGPGEVDEALLAELDRLVPPEDLSHLGNLSDEQLATVVSGVDGLEQNVSRRRKALFDVIDRLQAEIVRRYRTGEANVDNLLA